NQAPLNLTSTSVPEPDLAVVPGGPRDYKEHPGSALLVIEVCDTTLAYERKWKLPLYAHAGTQEYWNINMVEDTLEVYRDPMPDSVHPKKSSFATKLVLHKGEGIAPLAKPGKDILVEELLP
ncbi:MAG: Uma2 family endonuclease, partial [Bdellovibrionales bacterium]